MNAEDMRRLSNDELASAITQAWCRCRQDDETSVRGKACAEHLKALLEAQAKRAQP